MKYCILLFTLLMIQFGTVQAQEFDSEKNNYAVLSKNIQQLKQIILTVNELQLEHGSSYGDFIVIICGSTVKDISQNRDFEELLEEAQKNHIAVYACGLSLEKFNVNIQRLPENLKITRNGILYGLQLANKGFITLTI